MQSPYIDEDRLSIQQQLVLMSSTAERLHSGLERAIFLQLFPYAYNSRLYFF